MSSAVENGGITPAGMLPRQARVQSLRFYTKRATDLARDRRCEFVLPSDIATASAVRRSRTTDVARFKELYNVLDGLHESYSSTHLRGAIDRFPGRRFYPLHCARQRTEDHSFRPRLDL